MKIKDLGRRRAMKAYQFVSEATEKLKGENLKKYKSYVKKLPMLIKTNGLASAIAFVHGKKEQAWSLLYKQVEDWAREQNPSLQGSPLVKTVIEVPTSQYMALTGEVLSLLEWMRRFADGMIEGESSS